MSCQFWGVFLLEIKSDGFLYTGDSDGMCAEFGIHESRQRVTVLSVHPLRTFWRRPVGKHYYEYV